MSEDLFSDDQINYRALSHTNIWHSKELRWWLNVSIRHPKNSDESIDNDERVKLSKSTTVNTSRAIWAWMMRSMKNAIKIFDQTSKTHEWAQVGMCLLFVFSKTIEEKRKSFQNLLKITGGELFVRFCESGEEVFIAREFHFQLCSKMLWNEHKNETI